MTKLLNSKTISFSTRSQATLRFWYYFFLWCAHRAVYMIEPTPTTCNRWLAFLFLSSHVLCRAAPRSVPFVERSALWPLSNRCERHQHTHPRTPACSAQAHAWAVYTTHTGECLPLECGCAQRTSNESGEASLSNRIDWFEHCSRPITVYNRWSQTYPPRFFFLRRFTFRGVTLWMANALRLCVFVSEFECAHCSLLPHGYWSFNILFILLAAVAAAVLFYWLAAASAVSGEEKTTNEAVFSRRNSTAPSVIRRGKKNHDERRW